MLRKTQATESELTELRWAHDALGKSIEEKEMRLDHVHSESSLELYRLLDDFASKMAAKAATLRQLTASLDAQAGELEGLRAELMACNSRRGEVVSLKAQLDRQMAVLCEFIEDTSRKLGLSPTEAPGADSATVESAQQHCAAFLEQLDAKVGSIQDENRSSIQGAGAEVAAVEKELLDVRSAVQKAKLELDLKEKELQRINGERTTLRYTQTRYASANTDLVSAKCEHASAVAALEEHCHGGRANESVIAFQAQLGGITEELRRLTELIARNQSILEDVSSLRSEHDKIAAQHTQLDTETVRCRTDVEVFLDNCARDHLFDLSSFPDRQCVAPSDLERYSVLMEQQCKFKKAEAALHGGELREVRNNLAHVGALVTQDSAAAAALEKEVVAAAAEKSVLKELVDELNAVRVALDPAGQEMPVIAFDVRNCSDREVSRILEEAERTSGHAVEMALMVESASMFYAKFEASRRKTNACPCCSKAMTESEVAQYDLQLRKLLKVNRKKDELDELKMRAATLGERLQTVGGALKAVSAKQQQLDALKTHIREYQDQKSVLLMQETEADSRLRAAETQLGLMDRASIEVGHIGKKWEGCSTRLAELDQRRARLQTQMQSTASMYEVASGVSAGASAAGSSVTADMTNYHDSLESELREFGRQKEALQARKDAVKEEESRFTKKNFSLKSNLAEKEKVLSEKQQNSDKYTETMGRLAELDIAIKDLEHLREEQTRSISPLQTAVREKETTVATAKGVLVELEQRLNASVSAVRSDKDSCGRLLDMVVDLSARRKQLQADGSAVRGSILDDIKAIDAELARAQAAIEEKEESMREVAPKRDQLRLELSSQEQTKKVVQDNIDLRECISDREKKGEQIRRLEEKLRSEGSGGGVDIQRELQRAEQMRQKLSNERASLTGRVSELSDQMIDIDTKLGNACYNNIDGKYRRKMIEYETTLVALTDLDSYFSTL